jgi:hypothetical protein
MYNTGTDNFEMKKAAPLANYVLAPESSVRELPDQYSTVQCFGDDETSRICLLKRPGSCKIQDEAIRLVRRAGED